MQIETDLKKIKAFSEKYDEQNWKFRLYLKNSDISDRKLDNIVHEIYEKVSSQINCRDCANCCKVLHPIIRKKDVSRLTKLLNISNDEFIDKYLKKDENGTFVFKGEICPFLVNNSCTVYENRPEDCHSFPHLHKSKFRSRLMGIVINSSLCPIIFNVYQKLKLTLRD